LQLVMERIGWALRDAFEGYLLLRKRQRTHSGTMRELLGLWSFDPLA
jgi:hypothetical protein